VRRAAEDAWALSWPESRGTLTTVSVLNVTRGPAGGSPVTLSPPARTDRRARRCAGGMITRCAILACVQAITEPKTDLAGDLFALVVYLHKNCNSDLFEAMGALELTTTQIKLLHHLEAAPRALTLKQAAELVVVSLPAASRTVDDLVRRGFVERHEDVEDRRMKRVSATEAGRAVIRRLNAARLDWLEQFADSLNDTERRELAAALAQLLRRPDLAACRPERADS
jgi:DNA-binding MarR family transcriptional regulator